MRTPSEIDALFHTTYARNQIILERGKGCRLWDTSGKEYLDFFAGIATASLGHDHPAICETLAKQSAQLMHVSNLYYSLPQAELAAWFTKHSCADRAFFCNSGAEANEAAIKLTRKYSHAKHGSAIPIILTAQQSFHGRTLATLTATGQTKYQKGFEPLVAGFEHVPFNDIAALEETVQKLTQAGKSERVFAAILLEPLQGEGGVTPGQRDYFLAARQLCDKHGALLIFDEIQCGMGRSGKLWGYEKLGVEPDIFTSAKGLAGGFPIGAMVAKESVSVFQHGEHGSTFGGNPLACAVACTVAGIIGASSFLEQVEKKGTELQNGLTKLLTKFPNHLQGTRGWGLIQGLVLKEDSELTTSILSARALEHGLLLIGAGPKVVRLVPPLIISSAEIQEGLEILERILAQ
ncbi:MAG: aspartate aminotransferase family protein [Deltaproteobacteria bacterium]|nr:aspartate aminotransferase family protein [Deltaproteobacteria bacterium]